MKQLENILTRNNINFLKTDNQDLNILRDDRWVEMFNELGYERGNIYFINNNGPFFIVFPDNMIGTATNVMLPDAINCLEEELELNLQIPSDFGKIYTDESDDDCAIIIFNIDELESILNQNINESKKLKNRIRLTESELHNLIKESVKKVLKENTEYSVWDLLDEMKEYMSDYDILARLISRIGEDVAMDMLTDIKAIEIGDNDDTLTEGQGWNFFKSNHKDIWNGKYDDTFNKMSPKKLEREKQYMDNYINADKKETHYNKLGEYSYPTTDDPNNKKTKVNKSKWGKIGRAAGVAGTIASLKARRALNNLKKDLKN